MKIDQLTKKISQRVILENINIDLEPGEMTGLIGRNGSGKTTLFRTIVGHYLADCGTISIDGKDIQKNVELQKQIFYIDEQYNFMNRYTLLKISRLYQNIYPAFDFDQFLGLVQKQELPLTSKYRALSKGMQGLFNIILAICSNAPYLILDEPFNGLDVIVRKNVIRLLLESMEDKKRSIFISSHNLKELESLIDRALLLKDTRIAQNYQLENMRENARKIQMVFAKKGVPEVVKGNSKVLSIQGRVITAIFEEYTKVLEAEIKALEPLVFEELPLSLEDLFEANLSRDADYQLFT